MNLLTGAPGGAGKLLWRTPAWIQQKPAGVQSTPYLQSTTSNGGSETWLGYWPGPTMQLYYQSEDDAHSPDSLSGFTLTPPAPVVPVATSQHHQAPGVESEPRQKQVNGRADQRMTPRQTASRDSIIDARGNEQSDTNMYV